MEERILVCLSSSPSNGKIIRTAAQMAEAFNGTLTALFVETPLAGKMGKEDQERLKENIKLAKQSGAEIETGLLQLQESCCIIYSEDDRKQVPVALG